MTASKKEVVSNINGYGGDLREGKKTGSWKSSALGKKECEYQIA